MAATFQLHFYPSGGQPIAEIGFQSANGGCELPSIKLTTPCTNFEEFATELKELRKELDKMEKEAKERFSIESPTKDARENYKRLLKDRGQKNLAKFSRIKRRV